MYRNYLLGIEHLELFKYFYRFTFIFACKNRNPMIKPLATLLTIWGLIMFLITFFVFLNSPANIEYNDQIKYSMLDSGVSLSFLISSIMLITGVVLLRVSRVPRYV